MSMTRLERYHFLCYFGGGNPIPWAQVIQIGTLYIADPTTKIRYDIRITKRKGGKVFYQWEFQRMLSDGLRNGLVKKVENAYTKAMRLQPAYLIEEQDYDYQITEKGDECLRAEQMARAGDTGYYKYFKRDPNDHRFDGPSNGLILP